MKKLFTVCLLSALCSVYLFSQDKITTKDNKQLDVKIVEKTNKSVRYTMPDYTDGPVLMLKNRRIMKLEYKNGVTDQMGYQNPRKNNPFGISIGGGKWVTPGLMFTASMDYFIIPQLDMEVNMGTDSQKPFYLSAGPRIHINSRYSENRLTPFTGALFGYEYGKEFVQIPLGVNYIYKLSKWNLNFSLSVNELMFSNEYQTVIEFRGGVRFRL
jgi:hypothetical protein